MQGNVAIVVIAPDGSRQIYKWHNLVLDIAREDIMNILLGNESPVKQFTTMTVAYGDTLNPPVNSDTALEGTTVRDLNIITQDILTTYSLRLTSETVQLSGQSETFNELGLFREDRIFSRVVLPSVVTIPDGSQYSILWTITF